jgi:hypothetical protein
MIPNFGRAGQPTAASDDRVLCVDRRLRLAAVVMVEPEPRERVRGDLSASVDLLGLVAGP